jgi:hypothetical protein
MQKTITNWAKVGSSEDPLLHKGFGAWIPSWYLGQKAFNKYLLNAVILLSFFNLSFGSFLIIKRIYKKIIILKPYLLLSATMAIGVVCWFIAAPDFRYGYVFMVPFFVFLLQPLIKLIFKILPSLSRLAPSIGMLLCMYALYYHYTALQISDISNYPKLPPDYKKVGVNVNIVNNQPILSPSSGDQCWYAELPCTPYVSEKINWSEDSIKEGFDWKN